MIDKIQMTEADYADGAGEGRCLACGASAGFCEPDAREYECENCGEKQVYGLEELMMMGKIEFVGPPLNLDPHG